MAFTTNSFEFLLLSKQHPASPAYTQMEEESFLLPVSYKGEELELETTLKPYGYIYRFEVNVNGTLVQFEPDEERNYRALLSPEAMEANRNNLSIDLLQAIAKRLKALHQ